MFFCATRGRVGDRASPISRGRARSPSGGIEEWAKGSSRAHRVRVDLEAKPDFSGLCLLCAGRARYAYDYALSMPPKPLEHVLEDLLGFFGVFARCLVTGVKRDGKFLFQHQGIVPMRVVGSYDRCATPAAPAHEHARTSPAVLDASWQMWHVDPASAGHATTAAAAAFAARSDAYAIQAGPRRTASHPFATQAARASDWSSSNANMRATRY